MNRGYFLIVDNEFNRENYRDMIGKRYKTPPSYVAGVFERDEFDKIPNMELVAYWNVLQFGLRMLRIESDNQTERHIQLLAEIFDERGIPYEVGKRIIIRKAA